MALPRRWTQFHSSRDLSGPTAVDDVLDDALKAFTDKNVKRDPIQDLERKEKVLKEIQILFNDWVRQCAKDQGIEEFNGRALEGRLETSGSWRLGIHEKDADIDLVCVAPRFCSHELFFDTFQSSIQEHPLVTNFNSIPGAFVPIMTFDFREVNIDLLLAVLPHIISVPATFDILDDSVLGDMSEASRRSINGPRDTLTITKLVEYAGSVTMQPPKDEQARRYDCFLRLVRCLRLWAKKRCIYSNKMGYLGGINFNILATMIIQFYPNKSPGFLLVKFFECFAQWDKEINLSDEHTGVRWQTPVRVCAETKGVSSHLDEDVYPKTAYGVSFGDMPIVTPSYPAYNSAGNVNPWTLRVMNAELARGMQIMKQVEQIAIEGVDRKGTAQRMGLLLDELIEPSDFFWRADYQRFIAIRITADDQTSSLFASFKTLTEAMFRNVISAPKYRNLGGYPMKHIHLLPKSFEGKSLTNNEDIEGDTSMTLFIAFTPIEGHMLELGDVVGNFELQVKKRFEKDYPEGSSGIHIKPHYLLQKQLPDFVFELGDIGIENARKLRKQQQRKLKAQKEGEVAEQLTSSAMNDDDDDDDKESEKRSEMTEMIETPQWLLARGKEFEIELLHELNSLIKENVINSLSGNQLMRKHLLSLENLKEIESWFEGLEHKKISIDVSEPDDPAIGSVPIEEVKPLWVAVAEEHQRIPALYNIGDTAVRTKFGTYVSKNQVQEHPVASLPPPKRIKRVNLLY